MLNFEAPEVSMQAVLRFDLITVYAKDDSHFEVRAEEIWKYRDEKSLGLQIGSHPQVLTYRP